MTKQEQIREMAKILHSTHAETVICIGKDCNFCKHADLKIFDDYTCIDLDLAEALHNEGYRKVDEVRKETADKIFNDIFALINNANDKSSKIFGNSSDYGKGYKNSVSHFNEHILELAKQYGVEVE